MQAVVPKYLIFILNTPFFCSTQYTLLPHVDANNMCVSLAVTHFKNNDPVKESSFSEVARRVASLSH